MARLVIKSLDDYIEDVRSQLQDSKITEVFKLNYFVNTTQYILPGYKNADPRILEIVSIEGVGYDGNFITETDLTVPTDYSLWNDYGSTVLVPAGYGASSDKQVFTGITIATLTFQDNSSVFITFKWQNPDFRPLLTNFTGTSRLRMILSSIATNLQQYLVPIADTVNSFSIDAGGDDLKRILGLVGGTVVPAVETTGKVEITNTSGSAFSISGSMRFAAISSGAFILFRSVTGSGTIADGATDTHAVIAVQTGTVGNVGSYSITKIYTDDTLAVELTTATLTVTNPPVIIEGGVEITNYFDNGIDEDDDEEIRRIIALAFQTLNTSSYSTIETAVLGVATVKDVVVYDGDIRKGVLTDTFEVYAASASGVPFSAAALSQIKAEIDLVKPVGTTGIVNQVPHTYLTFKMTIYTDSATLDDTTALATLLTTTMTSYINDRQIGEDVLPSTMLSLAKANAAVKDVEMTEITITESVSEVNSSSTELNIYDTASKVGQMFMEAGLNSVQKAINTTYTGTANFSIAEAKVDERDALEGTHVHKAVLGHDNKWRPDPREVDNYFTGVTGDQQIDYDDTLINSGQEILVDYNYYDNNTISGIRVWLRATAADSVRVRLKEVNAGLNPDDGTGQAFITNADKTLVLTGDGVARLYEFEFASDAVIATGSLDKDIYILIESSGTPSGIITLPVDIFTANRPAFWADGDPEGSPDTPDGTFTQLFWRGIYETYRKYTGVNSYQKVIIPSTAFEPEKPKFRSLTLTFTVFTEE